MTEEDEAFDEIARKQGMWGGGFHAKRAAAADKLFEDQINYGTSWSKDGERIDPTSVYLDEPAQGPMPTVEIEYTLSVAGPAQEPQTCQGRKCQASDTNGFEHSPECIVDTAKGQGWSDAPEAIAAMQTIQAAQAQPAQEPVQDWKTLPKKDAPLVEWAKGQTMPAAQPTHETDMLTIAYQSGYHDGKKAALAGREWNFCERCGKRTKDLTVIHTCTPPQEGT